MINDINSASASEKPAKPKRKNWLRGCLLVIGFIGLVVFALAKLGLVTIGTVNITNVYLASGLDDRGTPIPSGNEISSNEQSRIICIVELRAPKPVFVGVRWFYEDQIFADRSMQVDRRQGFVIETSNGEKFKAGNYRIEVYLTPDGGAVRTLDFTVK